MKTTTILVLFALIGFPLEAFGLQPLAVKDSQAWLSTTKVFYASPEGLEATVPLGALLFAVDDNSPEVPKPAQAIAVFAVHGGSNAEVTFNEADLSYTVKVPPNAVAEVTFSGLCAFPEFPAHAENTEYRFSSVKLEKALVKEVLGARDSSPQEKLWRGMVREEL